MSLTRSPLEELYEDRVLEVDVPRGRRLPRPRPLASEWLTEPGALSRGWARALGLSWVVVFALAVAVEPAPANPDAPEPLWASLLFLSLLAALGATVAGLSRGRRAGILASVAAGGLALLGTVMCPVSDHHETIGAWWYLQMVGFTGLIGAGLVALRRARPTARVL